MFFGHCYRTRFCDSFCLASVFEMTVYLLTYLLTYPTPVWVMRVLRALVMLLISTLPGSAQQVLQCDTGMYAFTTALITRRQRRQLSVLSALVSPMSRQKYRPIPILPNTGNYQPIPYTQVLVSYKPYW